MIKNLRKNIASLIAPPPVNRSIRMPVHQGYIRARSINHSPSKVKSLRPKQQSGRSMQMASLNRLTNDWVRVAQSVNYDLYSGLSVMRARGKDLLMNDPIAKKFIALIKKNVVGPNGFTLKVKSFDWVKQNGQTVKQFDKFANRFIQGKFQDWSKKKNCSILGQSSFREINNIILSNIASQGEMFINYLSGSEFGDYGFKLQVLDPGLIDERLNKKLSGGNYIQMGIEYDSFDRPVRYWLRQKDEQNDLYTGGNYLSTNYKPIDAENICHLFIKEFPEQRRGISWFAPAALRMHMLNKASEAAAVNFRVGASKTLVLRPTENYNPDIENSDESTDPYGNILENVEPGETYKIPYGYEPFDYNPTYPNSEFGIFTDAIMMQIASGFDVTHPSLSGNYSGTTWTSSRTALIDERDGWKTVQNWFKEHFLDDTYSAWLKMFLYSKMSNPLPPTKFDKFNSPTWYGRSWEWVDPEKEVNAQIKNFKYHFETFAEILARRGKDLEEHLEEIADEQNLFNKYGIEMPPDIPPDTVPNTADNQAAGSSRPTSKYFIENNNHKNNGVHNHA